MIGLGTIINTAAILAGGLLGMLFGRFLKDTAQDSLSKACGIGTIFIAIYGVMNKMPLVAGDSAMLVVVCLVLGTLTGELLRIEDGFERFGSWLKVKTGKARTAASWMPLLQRP